SRTVDENTTLIIDSTSGLLANVTDVDSSIFEVVSYTIDGMPAKQPIGSPVTIPDVGIITIDADGSFSFAPATGYTGAIPAITYTISDGNGGTDTSVLALTIVPGPITPAADVNVLPQNTPLSVDAAHGVLSNDLALAGEALMVTTFTVGDQTAVAGNPVAIPGVGTLTINPDGSYSFAPLIGYAGAVPVATYTVEASSGVTSTATLTLEVLSVPPTAKPDSIVTDPNIPVAIDVLQNDIQIAGNTYTVVQINGQPISVEQPVTLPDGSGVVSLNSDGTLVFTPAATIYGNTSFTYTIMDDKGGSSTSTVSVTIRPPSTFIGAVPFTPGTDALSASSTEPYSVQTSGIVVDTVERTGLNSHASILSTERIVLDAVNSARSLNGMTELPSTDSVVGFVNRAIDEQRIAEAASDLQGDLNSQSWMPDGMMGFSLHSRIGEGHLDNASSLDHKLVVEALVRDGTLYIQLKDFTALDTGHRVDWIRRQGEAQFTVQLADGRPVPEWLSVSSQALLIGQRPANIESIDLRIVASFPDGATIIRYVSINTDTGEIEQIENRRAGLERPVTLSQQFAALEPGELDFAILGDFLADR
ncbi:MAG: cadherin-like domain-containing protein, partial [Hyphomicrobiaceae bacterium]|nr:cadherin-like domain-containing protein [Hyphomicrobiaceae bacterium]